MLRWQRRSMRASPWWREADPMAVSHREVNVKTGSKFNMVLQQRSFALALERRDAILLLSRSLLGDSQSLTAGLYRITADSPHDPKQRFRYKFARNLNRSTSSTMIRFKKFLCQSEQASEPAREDVCQWQSLCVIAYDRVQSRADSFPFVVIF